MKLINPTDDQLDAAFAIEIVGRPTADNYTRSADAVMPWLEKARKVQGIPVSLTLTDAMVWGVWLGGVYTWDEKLSRAAVIALLRANGVEVGFTT